MSCSDTDTPTPQGKTSRKQSQQLLDRFGVPIDATLQRRERFANRFDYEFGQERVFPELVEELLQEVPEGARLLEVGAATGLLTEPLLKRAAHLTALEPSAGMLRRLVAKDVAESPNLTVVQGMAEDLLHDAVYDVAVVTFTPRRGVGLLRLLHELASRVTDRVVMLLRRGHHLRLGLSCARGGGTGLQSEPTDPRRRSPQVARGSEAGGAHGR